MDKHRFSISVRTNGSICVWTTRSVARKSGFIGHDGERFRWQHAHLPGNMLVLWQADDDLGPQCTRIPTKDEVRVVLSEGGTLERRRPRGVDFFDIGPALIANMPKDFFLCKPGHEIKKRWDIPADVQQAISSFRRTEESPRSSDQSLSSCFYGFMRGQALPLTDAQARSLADGLARLVTDDNAV